MKLHEDFRFRSKLRDVGRWYVTRFVADVAHAVQAGSRLLDAGDGECVNKQFFPRMRYVSIDLTVGEPQWNYHNLDWIGALDRLPFQDRAFGAILCTETLEQLEWPRKSVQEFFCVLKPGSTLYLTTPMAHPERQTPFDFFRFTSVVAFK